ncbi:MAG: TRAP transporter substrate-binding protein [Betaproteobacteria bacterium]|nr:TRAP transporter substrate-binding protein [Betaproteobacteria bacterium]
MKLQGSRLTRRAFLRTGVLLVGGASLGGLAVCARAQSPAPSKPAGSSASTAAQRAAPITLRLAHYWPTTSQYHQGAGLFAQMVKDATGGRIDIKIFPAEQLVKSNEMYNALSKGTVDMGYLVYVYFSSQFPWADAFTLPFVWKSNDAILQTVSDKGFSDEVYRLTAADNALILGWQQTGAIDYFTKKPVKTKADFKGILIRTSGGSAAAATELLGAKSVSMSTAEVIDALQRGTVDAVLTTGTEIATRQLYRSVPYGLLASFRNNVLPLVISKQAWDRLPADLQQALVKVGQEWTPKAFAITKALEKTSLDQMKANKMTLYTPTDAEVADLKKVTQPLYENYVKKNGQQGEKILGFLKKYN